MAADMLLLSSLGLYVYHFDFLFIFDSRGNRDQEPKPDVDSRNGDRQTFSTVQLYVEIKEIIIVFTPKPVKIKKSQSIDRSLGYI